MLTILNPKIILEFIIQQLFTNLTIKVKSMMQYNDYLKLVTRL